MITEVQKSLRANAIGSSDVAAILGRSPYQTAWDIWAKKTGRLPDNLQSEAAELGDQIEPSIVKWACQTLEMQGLEYDVVLPHPQHDFFIANTDAIGLKDSSRAVIEAKTAGLCGPLTGHWGDDWSDEVPEHYWLQCQFQMLCGGLSSVFLAALLGGRGRHIYHIRRDEPVLEMIVPILVRFWRENVQADAPPEKSLPSMDTIAHIKREHRKRVPISDALVQAWQADRQLRLDQEKLEAQTKAAMLAALGDAEEGELPDGRILTYYKIQRAGYTVSPTAYRTPKLLKGKSHDHD